VHSKIYPPSSSAESAARPLGDVALRGSFLTGAQVLGNKVLATLSAFMLGALLVPEDFGLAGIAVSIGATLIVFQTWVFVDVAIAEAQHGRRSLAAAQASAIMFGIAESVSIMAAAPFLERQLVGKSGLVALLFVVALRPFADAIGVGALARLKTGLRFRSLAAIDGSTAAASSAAAVILALCGAGPFAIVAPPIATSAIRGIIYATVAPAKSERRPSLADIRTASYAFVKPAIAAYLGSVTFLIDSFILGVFVNERAMGIYAFSFNLAVQTTFVVAVSVAGTVQPIFAAMGGNRQRQADGLLRTVRLVSVIAVPAAAVQAAFAGSLFEAIWRDKWIDAVPVFAVLSIGQATVFAATPSIFLLKAQGRFGGYLKLAAAQLVFTVLATLASAKWGGELIAYTASRAGVSLETDAVTPLATACTTSLGWSIFGPLAMWLACKRTTIKLPTIIGVTLRPWLAAGPVAGIGALVTAWLLEQVSSTALRIIIAFGGATSSFVLALWLASNLYESTRGDLSALLSRVAGWVRNRSS